ncbi:lipase family alpha/beta hydrolase [Aquisphaera insulae]|uniref:lipase family alpha/beta hydrolase n=1 Tax=Aquisphaera insulae TaxID=2712864 RepID=UPI0013EBA876|nr:alpha/beta hydrolase [Aquisphaera insulae]
MRAEQRTALQRAWSAIFGWLRGRGFAAERRSSNGYEAGPSTAPRPSMARTVVDHLQTFLAVLAFIFLGGEAFEAVRPWRLDVGIVPFLLGLIGACGVGYLRTRSLGGSRWRSVSITAASVAAAMVLYAEWSARRGLTRPLTASRLESIGGKSLPAGSERPGFRLEWMPRVSSVGSLPSEGRNEVIVAEVDRVLHLRVFDGDGVMVMDTDENRLMNSDRERIDERARILEELRKWPRGGPPSPQLSPSQQRQVIDEVLSLFDSALIVLVHGFGGPRTDGYRQLVGGIKSCRPGDDLLQLSYSNRLFSNADPAMIADEINDQIDKAFNTRRDRDGVGYREVILVGHSVGALLVRKAYLYGRGHTDDAPGWPPRVGERPWSRRVGRIVLLAGVNRGWRSDPFTVRAGGWIRGIAHLGDSFAWATGTAELLRGFQAGSPFVANLRIQWIRLGKAEKPTVVQLLGIEDEVVGIEDSKDVAVNSDFIFVPVRGSNHASILGFDDPTYGPGRWAAFRDAMDIDHRKVETLKEKYSEETYESDQGIKKVVFVVHGIRDMGQWTSQIEAEIQGRAKDVMVLRPRYGYFPMGPFLLFEDRQKYVRWFMDEYTEALARYPNAADDVNYVGHSNGTYVLASALARYRTLRINRAMFAGSVVPRDYDWNDRLRRGQVRLVRNDLASADWVVAIFPRMIELFYETLGTWFGPSDIGSAGFNGFLTVGGNMTENYYLEGDHGAALQAENIPSVAGFILGEDAPAAFAPRASAQPAWLVNLSHLCWLVWGGIALVLVLAYPAFRRAVRGLNALFCRVGLALKVPEGMALPLYGILLIVILYTY